MPGTVHPRRRRTPEAARREILDAAARLLGEGDSAAVTVSAVMAATTLSRKSFYVYFRDRSELLTALVTPLRADADAAVRAWAQAEDPVAAGRRLLDAVSRLYEAHGHLLRALAEASRRDPEANRTWRAMTEPVYAVAAERIREQQARDPGLAVDPDAAARALIDMNLSVFFRRLDEPELDREAAVALLATLWERAVYGGAP